MIIIEDLMSHEIYNNLYYGFWWQNCKSLKQDDLQKKQFAY